MYQMSVNVIKQNNKVAYENPCIVCNREHRFENCDTLNNTAFLCQHYIHFCQNVRKDHVALTSGQGGNRPSNANVNYLDMEEYCNKTEDSDEELDDTHFLHDRF